MLDRNDLRLLPKTPGAYLLKDKEGRALYISWTEDIKSAVTSHSKAIGSPREKAISLAYHSHLIEIKEGATEDDAAAMTARLKPEFNQKGFDPTRAEASRLTLVIKPEDEPLVLSFAKLRYVKAKRKGEMTAPTPAEYLRFLLNDDMRTEEAAIYKRRNLEDL